PALNHKPNLTTQRLVSFSARRFNPSKSGACPMQTGQSNVLLGHGELSAPVQGDEPFAVGFRPVGTGTVLTLGLRGRLPTRCPAVSLIIHGLEDAGKVYHLLLEAADLLAGLDHEILVMGGEVFLQAIQANHLELSLPTNVRWLPCPVAGGYRAVLHA